MNLDFDLDETRQVEFRVAIRRTEDPEFSYVDVTTGVKTFLRDIADDTWQKMNNIRDTPALFDPSNDFSPTSFFYLPLTNDLAVQFRHIYNYGNALPVNNALALFPAMAMYAVKFTDSDERTLYGVKQTPNARSRLKEQPRIRLSEGGLAFDTAEEFQIYHEFDFFIDSESVYVYRHVGFENIGRIVAAIQESARGSLMGIQAQMTFVNFEGYAELAKNGKTTAQLIASIRSKGHAQTLTQEFLIRHCDDIGVRYTIDNGVIIPDSDPNQAIELLKIINRKYTHFDASETRRERYRSTSSEEIV